MKELKEDISNIKFTSPARILNRAAAAVSEEDLMKLAEERSPDPAAFTEFPPVFFPAEITNNRLDSYFTRMMPSSLKNYADEANAGVPFQNCHDTGALGMGRTLTATFTGAQGNGLARVVSNIFVIRGLPDTDNFVSKWRTGVATDVSIGFYGGRFICSICGGDMMDWRECYHYPGMSYDVEEKNKDGSTTIRKVTATADVEDAHLAEVSAVYKGSTPGAVILKAQRACEAGELIPEVARILENRYRNIGLELPVVGRIHAPGQPSAKENEAMTEEEKEKLQKAEREASENKTRSETLLSKVRAALKAAGFKDDATEEECFVHLGQMSERSVAGEAYREQLIKDALAEGVRALGDEFDAEAQQKFLSSVSVDVIRAQMANWKRVGDKLLAGGRATDDEADPANGKEGEDKTGGKAATDKREEAVRVPAYAYR